MSGKMVHIYFTEPVEKETGNSEKKQCLEDYSENNTEGKKDQQKRNMPNYLLEWIKYIREC